MLNSQHPAPSDLRRPTSVKYYILLVNSLSCQPFVLFDPLAGVALRGKLTEIALYAIRPSYLDGPMPVPLNRR
jgi:hypothetical protein